LRVRLEDRRSESSGTGLSRQVLEDSHRLSFIRNYKDLLLYLMLDKAAEQFLKQKYADELAAEELVVAF